MAESPELDRAVDRVRRLVELVRTGPVTRLRVDVGELHVDIEANPAPPDGSTVDETATQVDEPSPESGLVRVAAPLPGVFYRRPSPSEEPFVSVGDRVQAGQQVAIVEAMKLMNEVLADCTGTVAEILVEDSAVVEYGQPVLSIERG